MKKVMDLTGHEYNGIEVISRDYQAEKIKNDNKKYWKCKCHCGTQFSTDRGRLRSRVIKSCGCLSGGKGMTKNGQKNQWIIIEDKKTAIGITNKNERFSIDLEDLKIVEKYCWRKDYYGYIVANSKDFNNNIVRIHRIVMNPSEFEVVDHINWDKTNNKKENLRVASKSENNVNIKRRADNTNGYTGVKLSNNGKWKAQISFNRNRVHLGTFDTLEEAAIARNKAEKIIHKDFNGEINRKDFVKLLTENTKEEEESMG